jgi:hypothetical protein
MTNRRPAVTVSLILLLTSAVSCKQAVETGHDQVVPLPSGLVAVTRPKPLPDFTLEGINRPNLPSAELLGSVVVLRFWATH